MFLSTRLSYVLPLLAYGRMSGIILLSLTGSHLFLVVSGAVLLESKVRIFTIEPSWLVSGTMRSMTGFAIAGMSRTSVW